MYQPQASFPDLKDWFVYEVRGEKKIELIIFVLLFSIELIIFVLLFSPFSCFIGINQICNVYVLFSNCDVNAEYVV